MLPIPMGIDSFLTFIYSIGEIPCVFNKSFLYLLKLI